VSVLDRAGPPAPGSTATGPTLGTTMRSARGPVLVVLVLVVTGALVGLLGATGDGGRLDPDSYGPSGSRAVAELLRAQGVEVVRTDTVATTTAADGDVVVIAVPAALAPAELEQLAGARTRLVVVGADEPQLTSLGIPVEVRGMVANEPRRAACELPAATRAGEVDLGGPTYRSTGGAAATGCYAAGGDATLLELGRVVLLGDGAVLTNDRLDERGNAALALGVLAGGDTGRVVWLVPRPGRAVPAGGPTLRELIAPGVFAGAVQLLVVAAVLALWRARGLGRVVQEPLPVVVRAAEAVEGRGRLYAAAGARSEAAEALRAATRDRLSRRVGAGLATGRASLVVVVAERTGREPAEVDALLYGAAPAADDALVRLAGALRTLEQSLTREVPRT